MRGLRGSCALGVALAGACIAPTTTVAAPDPAAFATALDVPSGALSSAQFNALPPNGSPAVIDSSFGTNALPLAGNDLVVLGTGDARDPAGGGVAVNGMGTNNGGGLHPSGGYDVVRLRLGLDVPESANCLSLGVSFYTNGNDAPYADEQGQADGSYLDGFVADLDPDASTSTGADDVAPASDFAFTNPGNVGPGGRILDGRIFSGANGVVFPDNPFGTTYLNGTGYDASPHGATTHWMHAVTPITPGTHTVDLTIFDRGDATYDSTVLLDALRLLARADGTCTRGLTPAYVLEFDDLPPSVDTLKARTKGRSAKLKFTGSDTGGSGDPSFECRLDAGAYKPCSSPRRYKSLGAGRHTAGVRPIDGAGNIGEAASKRFRVKS